MYELIDSSRQSRQTRHSDEDWWTQHAPTGALGARNLDDPRSVSVSSSPLRRTPSRSQTTISFHLVFSSVHSIPLVDLHSYRPTKSRSSSVRIDKLQWPTTLRFLTDLLEQVNNTNQPEPDPFVTLTLTSWASLDSTQLSTRVYLKTVADRLKELHRRAWWQ